MYETKLKGLDGIAVYKSLHFSADSIGNFPEVGEMHADCGCHWRFFRERINWVFMFLFEIFHDAQNSMDLNFVVTILVFAHSKYFLMHITLSSKLAKHLFTPFVQ